MNRLREKNAVVTGSGRGIGRAIALRLAEEGANIAVNYAHSVKEAEEVASAIRAMGRNSVTIKADVGTASEVGRLMSDAREALGPLDILVNNAGVENRAPFLEVREEDFDRVLNINLKSVFFGSQAFGRLCVRDKRPGRIISISSVHEEIPFPGFAAYCASKGGVRMLTRNLSVELAQFGITVNGVAPGAIETDINRVLDENPDKKQALLAQIPLKRLGRPEDVAGVVAFLASDDGAYVTGSTYFVDGGLTWFYQE